MNILNKSYLHYTFQTALKVEIDYNSGRHIQGTFLHMSKIIHKWIITKFSSINVPKSICNFQKNLVSQSVEILYSYEDSFFSMKTTHADKEVANRMWITEAEIFRKDDELFLGVRNAYTSTSQKNEDDYKMYSVPTFVKTISRTVTLLDGKHSPSYISYLNSEQHLKDIYLEIVSDERQLPIIVISQNSTLPQEISNYFVTDDGYLLDGERLADALKFIAHVYYLPCSAQEKWSQMIGKEWGVYNGAVRTYFPHVNIDDMCYYNHPMLVPSKILAMNYAGENGREYYGGQAFRHILMHSIKNYNMHLRFKWTDIGYKFYNVARSEQLLDYNRKSEDIEGWCVLLEEDNDRLNKDLEDISALLEAQEEELKCVEETVRKYEAINTTNQMRIIDLEKQLYALQNIQKKIEYPKTYAEIPAWINDNFNGRIELLPKAVRSLKNAEYQNVQLVCELLQGMATIYYEMKMDLIERSAYESFIKSCGVEDTPAISDISAGEQGDEYYPIYNGKRHKLERHITKGNSRDPRECLRIYYFWDEQANVVVIGSLPGHLKIRSSN